MSAAAGSAAPWRGKVKYAMPILLPTLLAIETSSELASCALLRGDVILSRASSGVRTHSQSILPMVQELLAEAGVTLADVETDEPAQFEKGPIKTSSPVFKIAVAKAHMAAEDEEALLTQVSQDLAEDFVEVNKTVIE